MEEKGREDAGKPCWFNSFSGGARGDSGSGQTSQTGEREEEVGEDKRKEVKDWKKKRRQGRS